MAKTNNLFEEALKAEGITGQLADVARSIYMQESGGGKNTKTSNAGAVGGMQIIPSTFRSVADKDWDINDPMMNARAGIRYLKQLDKQAGGDPALTAAGYYGGPGGLEKARRGIAVSDPRNPKAPTTLEYGAQVAARLPGGRDQVKQAAPEVQMAAVTPVVEPAVQVAELAPLPDAGAMNQMAVAPAQVQGATGPDPWQQFLEQMKPTQQAAVQAQDLQYGQQRMPQLNVPDFLAMVPSRNRQVDFSAFGSWGQRA